MMRAQHTISRLWRNHCLFLVILLSLLNAGKLAAQGSVAIYKDPKVDKVLEYMHRQMVPLREKIWGFRLQLITSNSRDQVNDVKSAFIGEYHEVRSYVTYSSPNFKLRVGDFKTRQEASEFMLKIRPLFPGAFIVEDLVEIKNE